MSLNFALSTGVRRPLYVNIAAHGLMSSVLNIEKRIDFSLDTQLFLQEVVSCLEYKDTAQVELEMYGLSIMEQSVNYQRLRDAERFIKMFVKTGQLMLDQLLEHNCYTNNILQLVYTKHCMDNILFIDKKSMIGLLHEELNTGHKRSKEQTWCRPFLQQSF
jgi:hypothetical protein